MSSQEQKRPDIFWNGLDGLHKDLVYFLNKNWKKEPKRFIFITEVEVRVRFRYRHCV